MDHFRRADLSRERRVRSLALKGEGTGTRDEVEERAEVEEVEGKSLVRWCERRAVGRRVEYLR